MKYGHVYEWDAETGGLLLTTSELKMSKEPRPVYSQELDILGFDKYWLYPKSNDVPLMWAEGNNYIYRGRIVAQTKGGSPFDAPQIVVIEDPEPQGSYLRPVDLEGMANKNALILEQWVNDTIKKIENIYDKYKKKVDVFYVAFSGGKDSIVTLDLVQRCLPHNSFKVLFGDTGMEYPDTYRTTDYIQKYCEDEGIDFIRSSSHYTPDYTWKCFGPPATVNRWCCSVHKTSPQVLKLRETLHKPDFTGLAFIGVRASESIARSEYDYISIGEKHKGQYSCNPILDWNSAELYLYIYSQHLYLNEAYKKGNRRAGCLVCPRAADRSDYFANLNYPDSYGKLVNLIKQSYAGNFATESKLTEFIANGGWKARKNGRDINVVQDYQEIEDKGKLIIKIEHPKADWKEWIKTIGVLQTTMSPYIIKNGQEAYTFELVEDENGLTVVIDSSLAKRAPTFSKLFRNVFRKVSSCILCRVCEADCPHGSMHMDGTNFFIDDTCHHCSQCHKVDKGCLVYKSTEKPKGMNNMKTQSLNCYSHHAPKMDWFVQFFKYKNTFSENHSLGTNMYDFFKRFLKDAGLQDGNGFTEFAQIIDKRGLDDKSSWALMLVNLAYTPQFNWFYKRVKMGETYSKEYTLNLLVEDGAKESWVADIWSSFTRICELPFSKTGFGEMEFEKKKATSLTRFPWVDPDELTILYSLYKFAEACGDYKQFTLSRLLDTDIESDGITPVQLFGLDKDTLSTLLKGLSANYPDYINVTFTLNLDNITLRDDKTSKDVLTLF